MADSLKTEGNALYAAKDFQGSIEKFTAGIEIDPKNYVLYSNRSGSYASLNQFDQALEDAEMVISLKSDWPKGYTRKAAALHGQGDLQGAREAYEEALKLDPSNAQAKNELKNLSKSAMDPFAQAFQDPDLFGKLANNKKTSKYLADPQLMAKVKQLQDNPRNIDTSALLSDTRLFEIWSVLAGMDISFQEREPTSDGANGHESDTEMTGTSYKSKATKPEVIPEPEPIDEEAAAKKAAKREADAEKEKGTVQYKARNFDAAIEHYSKAWDLHKDINYLNNLAAAYFEKGDYPKCIEVCHKAQEEASELRTDFKITAKTKARLGRAYEKQGEYEMAISSYKSSLSDHRAPDVLSKLKALEKAKFNAERDAYINPEKAEEARALGGKLFKKADWPGAVKAYDEMIKRAPNDPRGYSNRAACLIKLLEFPSAVKDCEKALSLPEPNFETVAESKSFRIRVYLRKAQALHAMRQYYDCIDICYEASTQAAPSSKEVKEIQSQQQKAMQAISDMYAMQPGETEEDLSAKLQKDQHIQAIIQDPVIQHVLSQAKNNPAALEDHIKNPKIASSVQKLIAAGVIQLRR